MRAIESFVDRFGHRFRLEIRREHVRPRDGLQHSPVPARRAEQREDQQTMAELFYHAATLSEAPIEVKNLTTSSLRHG